MFSLYVSSLPQQTKTAFTSSVLFNFIVTTTCTGLQRDRNFLWSSQHIEIRSRESKAVQAHHDKTLEKDMTFLFAQLQHFCVK